MQERAQKMAVNTVAMYIKMILSLFVTFFSTRIILNNLGVTDFGIYNLVAGAISLLGFVNGSMANTVQRFLAHELGHGEWERLRKIFSISFSMHFALGIGLVVILEFLGIFAFDHLFVIEGDRIGSAKMAYHFMVGVTFFSTISAPLNACIYAHEDIFLFAIIDFISSVLKLLAALVLAYTPGDKLIVYCLFLLVIQIFYFVFEVLFCRAKYKECRENKLFQIDRKIQHEVFPFLGWNMLESCSWLIKNQGIAVLMNTFYGTIVNAAYGIGNQINGQVMYFSSTLLGAIRPQIYKAAGSGDLKRMLSLSVSAAKLSFCMMLLFLCPLFFVLDKILVIWLKNVPDYTERFCMLLMLISLFTYLSTAVNVAIQAYGEVKRYQVISSLIILVSVPIGYMLYSYSSNVYLFLYILVGVELLSVLIKYQVAANVLQQKFSFFFKGIFAPCIFVFLLSICTSALLSLFLLGNKDWLHAILFILLDVCMVGGLIYFIAFSQKEKNITLQIISNVIHKICKR